MKHILKVFLILGAMMVVWLLYDSEAKADTTWVSGTISTNTTWTPAGNPYIVIGGTRVDTNVILTIQPGVIVKFNPMLGLIIDGGLYAKGTASDSITFTAMSSDWSSLTFGSSSIDTICLLEYCRVDWSAYGVIFQEASPTLKYCNVSNNGGVGYDPMGPPLRIESGSAPRILYNTIKSNRQQSQPTPNRYGGGIDIQPGSSPEIIGNLIEDNFVSCISTQNGGWGGGICVRSDSAIIIGNTISGNTADAWVGTGGGGGIAVIGCSPLIACNEITGNIGEYGGGIIIKGGNPIITCNTIVGNTSSRAGVVNAGGMYRFSGEGVFALNNIYDNHEFVNSVFEVYAGTGSEPLIMENNWWGTTNPTEIDLLVYDFWDDPDLREIDFIPFSMDVNTPPVDSLVVISPNGGEEWWSDVTYYIQWNPFCFTDNVDIEYSTDGGSTWEFIAQNTQNFGLYPWEIPFAMSDSCRVRVSDAADGDPSDVSDSDFTICPGPTIIVTYPSGGETLIVDSTYDISWSTLCFDGNVKIEYSTNSGVDWMVIVDDTTNIGSIAWTVPNTPSPNCRVKISDALDGDPFDVSDDDFIIYSRGDVNGDGTIDIADVVYLINYLFIDGPAPNPLDAGDANCDGTVDIADVVYLINYLFIDGPPPGCP